ncbi:MAG: sulfatase-like hydrolase/transferase, partial [Desulfobulbia bacterium]
MNWPGLLLAQSSSPNILLIIPDDMGLDASACYPEWGRKKPEMTNLEALCKEGLVFENVWASPTCSPTRASILTGKYGIRTGIGSAVSPRRGNSGIRLSETSLQKYLDHNAPHKYAQAVIG